MGIPSRTILDVSCGDPRFPSVIAPRPGHYWKDIGRWRTQLQLSVFLKQQHRCRSELLADGAQVKLGVRLPRNLPFHIGKAVAFGEQDLVVLRHQHGSTKMPGRAWYEVTWSMRRICAARFAPYALLGKATAQVQQQST